MKRVLKEDFFERKTTKVALELLGKFLVRRIGDEETAFKIVETEAYDGHFDRASHASRGETKRNSVMFGAPGVWYVYFVYGMHEMLNIVTREKGYPAAVLIRGVEGFSGPGRLTKALAIDRTLSGMRAARPSGLWIEDRGIVIPKRKIKKSPRVGVDYAGEEWAAKPWRFILEG